ncbi:MAG: calcium-binding protein [Novosphingobium sp.]
MQLTTAGALAVDALTGVTGVPTIQLNAGGNSITLLNSNLTGVSGSKIIVNGGAGDDTVDASGLTGINAVDIRSGAGLDTLRGGAGSDSFRFAAADLAGDTISGGLGNDFLVLTTAGTLAPTALANLSGVEIVQLVTGTNGLTLVNGNYTGLTGTLITVFGNSGNDTLDASGLTGANAVDLRAGAGLDVLKGGAASDSFYFAASDLSGDTVLGGLGLDYLNLTSAGTLSAAAIANMSGVEAINLAAGTNSLTFANANFTGLTAGKITVTGSSGDDTIDASVITGTSRVDLRAGAGLDVLKGGAANDLFGFAAADLAGDTISGGLGSDILIMSTAGTMAANALANMSGVESINLVAGTNGLTLVNANYTGVASGRIIVNGNSGNDTLDASGLTGTNAADLRAGAGTDILKGGTGADSFQFAAANLDSLDTVTGNAGADLLQMTTAGALAANALTGMTGVETITLANGTNSVTLLNSNLTGVSGAKISVNGGTGNDTVDGSGLTGSNAVDVRAGAGLDTLRGGAGSDTFRFAAADLSSDTISAGLGNDFLTFSTAGTLGATALANMAGVEIIQLVAGNNGLTLLDANYTNVTGSKITVFGNSGNDTLDGSGLTGVNAVDMRAGAGLDVLKGGAGNDFFYFAAADLAGDTILGGLGSDFLILSTAGVLASNALANMNGVEGVNLAAGTNSLTFVTANFTGVTGAKITVTGGTGDDTIDGSAVTGANAFDFRSGAGLDVLRGGAGADFFRFTAADLSNDTVQGGSGNDTLQVTTAGTILASALANVSGVEVIQLANGTNVFNLTDAMVSSATATTVSVIGGTGDDLINGGDVITATNRLDLTAGTGNDTLYGGSGADTFRFAASALDAGDAVNGGTGAVIDTLAITGAGTIDLAGGNVQQIEALTTDNSAHTILLDDGVVGTAQNTTFSVTAGTGVDTLDLSRVENAGNAVQVDLGDGGDTLILSVYDPLYGVYGSPAPGLVSGTLGAGNDTLKVTSGYFQAPSTLSGGTGTDTIEINNYYGNSTTLNALVTGFEIVNLVDTITGGGYGVNFNSNDTAGLTVNGQNASNAYYIYLGAGGQTANGNALTDALIGGSGNNTLNGNGGDDTIDGRGGSNTADGGAGNDSVVWHAGDAVVAGGANTDTLISTTGGNFDLSQADQSLGDTVNTTGFENINLLQAYDPYSGYSLYSTVGGTAKGSSGANVINGSDFDDVLDGNGGADQVFGNSGADRITYRGSEQEINAYYQGYTYDVGQNDTLVLAAAVAVDLNNADQTSSDTVTVAGFQNVDATPLSAGVSVNGDGFNNRLIGGSGADTLRGNDGEDWIDGGAGLDAINSDNGNDIVTYRGTASTINGGADTDTLRVLGAATINLNNGDQTSGDTAVVSGFENVDGSASAATVTAIGRNDVRSVLIGGSAADTLTAGAFGADITGNGGADTLVGGAASDSFYINSGDVAAGESINGGGDTDYLFVRGTSNFSSATLSNLEYLFATAADANGNLLNQGMTVTLTGAQAAGFQYIYANGSYSGTTETFIINVASGTAVDLSAVSFYNFDTTDTLTINGAGGNETITAPLFACVIRGNGGNDTIKTTTGYGYWAEGMQVFGDAGNDRIDYGYPGTTATLDGGADSDTLVFSYNYGGIGDQFDLTSATDQSLNDTVTVRNFENLDWSAGIYSGLTVTGSSAANNIIGTQVADTIDGGAGLDVIDGQAGNDVITYRSTSSVIKGGADTDTLKVFSTVTIFLNNGDQTSGDTVATSGFENVDASGSSVSVTATGRSDLRSILIGGSAADTLTAGTFGSDIYGNGGADTLTGGIGNDNFYINSGDFAAGESINGVSITDYDQLFVRATTDFTVGTLTNLETLFAAAQDAQGNYLEQGMTVTLTGAQAARFQAISANSGFSTTAEAFVINVASGTTVNLSAIAWYYFDDFDSIAINGASGNETITGPYNIATVIHGNDGNDTLRTSAPAGGFWGDNTQVFGDAGNDRIDYGYRLYGTTLDGGADTDTLVQSYSDGEYTTIYLPNADQTIGDNVVVKNFENIDWSYGYGVDITGSSGANNILGSALADTIDGGAGLDVIDGQGGNDLITYRSTASTIKGGADYDTLKVLGAVTINLNNADQTSGDTVTVTGFENVDASGSAVAVTATGRDDLYSALTGGSAGDTLTAGATGAYITGLGGADTLVGGAGQDSFYIYAGDVAAGESINGGTGTDYLYVRGTSDFTVGSLSNVEYLYAEAADASGTPIEAGMTVTLTGAQAASFALIQANQAYSGSTAEAFIINVASGTTVDLSQIGWSSFDVNDSVAINGAAGNETITGPYAIATTIHGNGGNDTLKTNPSVGYWGAGTQVFGDAGNDRIDYGYRSNSNTIDGGADTDTLVYSYYEGVPDQIDLSQAADQSIGDTAVVKNFENLVWSGSYYGLTATGSSGANSIIGSQADDIISGGGGIDTIEGADGYDTLTGGAAGDVFVWTTRYNTNDTITDFLASEDDLRFTASAFDFNGAAFDQRLATASTATDITGKDLIIYTGAALNSVGDVQTYLSAATGGSVGEGVFIVGKDSANHTVLYHALDASYTVSANIVEIADLGTLTAPTSIQLADFLFV